MEQNPNDQQLDLPKDKIANDETLNVSISDTKSQRGNLSYKKQFTNKF